MLRCFFLVVSDVAGMAERLLAVAGLGAGCVVPSRPDLSFTRYADSATYVFRRPFFGRPSENGVAGYFAGGFIL
ncbi:MAG: hypothetical protein D8H97_42485 [Neisseria sp.]|nr:MAG: hypothetical protein D8H97_42485 [Neisseria sp.]